MYWAHLLGCTYSTCFVLKKYILTPCKENYKIHKKITKTKPSVNPQSNNWGKFPSALVI